MKRELLTNTVLKPLVLPTITPLSAGTTAGLWIDRSLFLSAVVGLATGAVTGTPTAQSVTVTLKTSDASNGADAVDLTDMEGNAVTIALTTGSAVIDKDVDLLGAKKIYRCFSSNSIYWRNYTSSTGKLICSIR